MQSKEEKPNNASDGKKTGRIRKIKKSPFAEDKVSLVDSDDKEVVQSSRRISWEKFFVDVEIYMLSRKPLTNLICHVYNSKISAGSRSYFKGLNTAFIRDLNTIFIQVY